MISSPKNCIAKNNFLITNLDLHDILKLVIVKNRRINNFILKASLFPLYIKLKHDVRQDTFIQVSDLLNSNSNCLNQIEKMMRHNNYTDSQITYLILQLLLYYSNKYKLLDIKQFDNKNILNY